MFKNKKYSAPANDISSITNLSHRYSDGTLALTNIDLSIAANEFIILAGSNGSGKSTLLKHMNGLLTPTHGNILLQGEPVGKNLRQARKRVGMVFQDADCQIVGETVWDDVAFGPRNLSLKKALVRERVEDALKTVGLTHLADKPPYLLSGGEKRRLAIAGILAMQPQVVAFDEPFSNLDLPGTRQVLKQMRRLYDAGHTLIVASHELEGLYQMATRLVVLSQGRIVRDGQPHNVLADADELDLKLPYNILASKN